MFIKEKYILCICEEMEFINDLDLFKSFKVKPVILLGLSHMGEADKGATHHNINIAKQLHEEGITVRVFITILPFIMNVDEMIGAVPQDIPVYLDKLRIFEKGNQNVKMYEWVKKHYLMYDENYSKILFEADEKNYLYLEQKYQNDSRITFMLELWNEI